MFAINHASAALLFKRKYSTINIIWLLISVQLIEYFWVFFNYFGLEITTTNIQVNYIGDIHLAYMPFSHSLLTTVILSLIAFLAIRIITKDTKFAIVISLAIASHFILDVVVHAYDLPLWYFTKYPLFGTNLYPSLPYIAFLIEIFFGIFCWWYYKGSKMLLMVIIIFNLLNFTTFSPDIIGLEKYFANQPLLLTSVIFLQIILTSFFVWFYSVRRSIK
ncbi:hypothetical protein ACFLSS_03965 [Bacteroidota bacterium]